MRIETLLVASLLSALACSSESGTPSTASGGSAGANGGSGASGGSAGTSNGGTGSAGSSNAGSGGAGSAGSPSGGASGSSGGSAGNAGSAGSGAGSGGSAGSAGSAGSTGGGGSGGSAPLGPVTVYIAGDSTVSTYTDTASTTDQAGWGQMLHESFSDLVTIENRAIGGRTSRRFIDEGPPGRDPRRYRGRRLLPRPVRHERQQQQPERDLRAERPDHPVLLGAEHRLQRLPDAVRGGRARQASDARARDAAPAKLRLLHRRQRHRARTPRPCATSARPRTSRSRISTRKRSTT